MVGGNGAGEVLKALLVAQLGAGGEVGDLQNKCTSKQFLRNVFHCKVNIVNKIKIVMISYLTKLDY